MGRQVPAQLDAPADRIEGEQQDDERDVLLQHRARQHLPQHRAGKLPRMHVVIEEHDRKRQDDRHQQLVAVAVPEAPAGGDQREDRDGQQQHREWDHRPQGRDVKGGSLDRSRRRGWGRRRTGRGVRQRGGCHKGGPPQAEVAAIPRAKAAPQTAVLPEARNRHRADADAPLPGHGAFPGDAAI